VPAGVCRITIARPAEIRWFCTRSVTEISNKCVYVRFCFQFCTNHEGMAISLLYYPLNSVCCACLLNFNVGTEDLKL
jgi:hypothetical protein